jgi:hypothetical protein
METNAEKVQLRIDEAISLSSTPYTKISLRDIPEIEEKDWVKLKEKLYGGQIQVREMSMSPISFSVFASDSEKGCQSVLHFLTIATPIVAIIFAFIYSWWALLLTFGSFLFMKGSKSIHKTVIFQAVTFSEIAFCFLFSRNTICLIGENGKVLFREND